MSADKGWELAPSVLRLKLVRKTGQYTVELKECSKKSDVYYFQKQTDGSDPPIGY